MSENEKFLVENLGINPEQMWPVIDYIDAAAITQLIPLRAVWSDRKTATFFALAERQPFKTEFKLATDFDEAFGQLVIIGRYLKQNYDQNRNDDKAASLLRSFFVAANYYLMVPSVYQLEDERLGLDRDAVKRGEKPEPNRETLDLFKTEAKGAVLDKIMRASEEGNLEVAWDYLAYYQGEPAVREVLQRVIVKRETNKNLGRKQLELVWLAESLRLEMGISLDDWCQLNNGHSADEIIEQLNQFLTEPQLWQEWQKHLQSEGGGAKNFWEMLANRARLNNFPQEMETADQRRQKVKEAKTMIKHDLPQAFKEDPRMSFLLADRLGVASRAWTMSYVNQKGELVSVEINNPRASLDELTIWLGHEIGGHMRQIQLLEEGTKSGLFETNPWPKIPGWLMEEAAMLVEDQFRRLVKPESVDKKPWPDLLAAYESRRSAVYGLAQISVRQRMEDLWKQGVRHLSPEQANMILQEFTPKIHAWFEKGMGIKEDHLSMVSLLNALDVFDGTKYLKEFLNVKSGNIGFKEIFRDRFGSQWLGKPQAMKLLDALMVKMGETHNYDELLKFAREAKVEE